MKLLAVGARAVGLAAGAFPFDKGAGQHFAEGAEAADEFAAEFQAGIGGGFHMTLILVSETSQVKPHRRFARMQPNGIRWRNPVNKRAGSRRRPYFTESLYRR